MDKLTGVNKVLRAIGEPRSTALDTGGTSDVAEAEQLLDEVTREILSQRWHINQIPEFEARPGLVRLTVTGSTGTFTYDEAITVGTKTGRFCYADGSYIYINPDSGQTFSTGTLTGLSSGATRTVTAVLTSTTGKIAVSSDWLEIEACDTIGERRRVVRDGSFLRDNDENTNLFDSNVWLSVVVTKAFADLSETLQNYIVASTAMRFQRAFKRGQVDDAMLREEVATARVRAEQWDSDQSNVNVLDSRSSIRARGYRTTTGNGPDYVES